MVAQRTEGEMALLQSQKTSNEDLMARIAALEAENAKLRNNGARRVSFKVSDKGALSIYGMGRFPVTLYKSQWETLLGMADDIKAFITANEKSLAVKEH
jgi:hypothetical protein